MSCVRKTLALMLIALFLLTLVTTSIAAVFANASPSWNIQTVDKNRVTNGIFIALDSNNSPHLAYSKYLQNRTYDLMYAYWNGSNWETKNVFSSISTETGGYFTLDSHNYPHIVYTLQHPYTGREANLIYASWIGNSWNNQTIDSTATATGQIVLDSIGNPHVCYLGNVTESPIGINTAYLMYATANEPPPTPTSSSAIGALTQSITIAVIVAVVVLVVAAGLLVYIKKHKPYSRGSPDAADSL